MSRVRLRGYNSVGRVCALQARSQEFKSLYLQCIFLCIRKSNSAGRVSVCHVGGRGFKSRLFRFRFMFFKYNNYKYFILLILCLYFSFYFGLDINPLQLSNDVTSNVQCNFDLDSAIEDSNHIPDDPKSNNNKKYIYIACGVAVVASLLLVSFFYYKGGDGGSSLSLGKDDFNDIVGVMSNRSPVPTDVDSGIDRLSTITSRASAEVSAGPGDASATSILDGLTGSLPELQRAFEMARESDAALTFSSFMLSMTAASAFDLELASQATQIVSEIAPGSSPINASIDRELRQFFLNFPEGIDGIRNIILARAQFYYTNYVLGLFLPGIEELLQHRILTAGPFFFDFFTRPAEELLESFPNSLYTTVFNIINNSTGGVYFSNNREYCNMLIAYLGTAARCFVNNSQVYSDVILQGGYDLVASIVIDFRIWEALILPGMTIENIRDVLTALRTLFMTYNDMVISAGIGVHTYMMFLEIESEDVFRNMLRIRELVISRSGVFRQNIIFNDMYLYVTLLSDIMREFVRLR